MKLDIDRYIAGVEKQLPEHPTTLDLIKLGIFTSNGQALQARKSGKSPEFITFSKKRVVYPKQGVISWLRELSSSSKTGESQC